MPTIPSAERRGAGLLFLMLGGALTLGVYALFVIATHWATSGGQKSLRKPAEPLRGRNFTVPSLEAEAHRIAHDILAMSEVLSGDPGEMESASISLLSLSAAFSAVAFVARWRGAEGQTEIESMIREELSYGELLSTYEEVRLRCKRGQWTEVNALCQREGARLAALALKLLV